MHLCEREAGADVKENGLFSDASHLEDWETHVSKFISWEDERLISQSPSLGKMGDSCLKAHLHFSVEAVVFIRRERGTEQRDQGRG